ncbi:MAG: glycosyl hydrolase family 65 protein [Acidimicrobiales bacterium]
MPAALDETFEAVVFDWDGTAVRDRQADASAVRGRVEQLLAGGVHLTVVTGTHVGNVDGQLGARPAGPGRLHLCCNRGSEVFAVTRDGPDLVERRDATPEEDLALDRAAERTVERLGRVGLEARVVSERLNRRKIDLIPEPAWADPKKADIDRLAVAVGKRLASAGIADLAEVVALAAEASREAGLGDPRITSDVKHVEIGLTDKSDSARWAARWLARQGITGGTVLVAGDEFGPVGGITGSDSFMMVPELDRSVAVSVGVEPGGVPWGVLHLGDGPDGFVELLDAQLARRVSRRVPSIDRDPTWTVPLASTGVSERVTESLGSLGNGLAGTRGSWEEDGRTADPLFLVAGVYTEEGWLLPGPLWTGFDRPDASGSSTASGASGGTGERVLDLRSGILVRSGGAGVADRSLRLVSLADPHAMALRAEGPPDRLEPGAPLRRPAAAVDFEHRVVDGVAVARTGRAGNEIAAAARDRVGMSDGLRTVERVVAWSAGSDGSAAADAFRRFERAERTGFDGLLAAHRRAWADRWADAEVVIEGDPDAELAARFAVFHLLSAAADSGEAAIGARGLTGSGYAGHVFWDADVFVLPTLCAIRPGAARAMLEYRIRRLPAARAAARAGGHRGARFPWESAADGRDVTPRSVRDDAGELVPIATGTHEEHIAADVAWAACHYADWTGEPEFLDGAGRDLVVGTARYWASRARTDPAGQAHLYGVEGPDEYHSVVDDNAFTNVMARWNLRRAADLLERSGEVEEAARCRSVADILVDGWHPARGLYEQFAGYLDLQPLLMADVGVPPMAADAVLGAQRVRDSQLIKQADVLMLHHLVPDEVVPGSLQTCFDFYEPRTAYGSSLAPSVHVSLLARLGRPDRALELFRLASRIDLDDLTHSTAGGLHLAALAGVWQALAFGFLGLRAAAGTLVVRPELPRAWTALGLTFRFGGRRVGVRAERGRVTIDCETSLPVQVGSGPEVRCGPGRSVLRAATGGA